MIAKALQASFEFAVAEAVRRQNEYVTLEHLLFALLHDRVKATRMWASVYDTAYLVLQSYADRVSGKEKTTALAREHEFPLLATMEPV